MTEFPPEWVEVVAQRLLMTHPSWYKRLTLKTNRTSDEARQAAETIAEVALNTLASLLAARDVEVRADEARRTAEKIRQSVIRLYTGNTRTDDDELGEYDCGVADAECIIVAVRDGLDPEREVIADVIANRATRAGSGA